MALKMKEYSGLLSKHTICHYWKITSKVTRQFVIQFFFYNQTILNLAIETCKGKRKRNHRNHRSLLVQMEEKIQL